MNAAGVIALASVHGVRLSSTGVCVVAMPSSKLTDELRREIRANKTELLRTVEPTAPCPACGCGQWWQIPNEPWHCRACEPGMPLTATTLTVSCHKARAQPVSFHAGLDRKLEIACESLTLTPGQLCQDLQAGGDIPDLVSGALTLQAIQLAARTLALMR